MRTAAIRGTPLAKRVQLHPAIDVPSARCFLNPESQRLLLRRVSERLHCLVRRSVCEGRRVSRSTRFITGVLINPCLPRQSEARSAYSRSIAEAGSPVDQEHSK